jgi:transposase-like protein
MRTEQKLLTTQTRQVFSEGFKRMVCEQYLNGSSNKEEISLEFGIKGKSSLLYWLRKFGYVKSNYKPTKELPFMAKSKKETSKSLEKENEDLKLQLEMYKRMISIAEKEFKISIVKKSDTK